MLQAGEMSLTFIPSEVPPFQRGLGDLKISGGTLGASALLCNGEGEIGIWYGFPGGLAPIDRSMNLQADVKVLAS